jgi:hypothetical protein
LQRLTTAKRLNPADTVGCRHRHSETKKAG